MWRAHLSFSCRCANFFVNLFELFPAADIAHKGRRTEQKMAFNKTYEKWSNTACWEVFLKTYRAKSLEKEIFREVKRRNQKAIYIYFFFKSLPFDSFMWVRTFSVDNPGFLRQPWLLFILKWVFDASTYAFSTRQLNVWQTLCINTQMLPLKYMENIKLSSCWFKSVVCNAVSKMFFFLETHFSEHCEKCVLHPQEQPIRSIAL